MRALTSSTLALLLLLAACGDTTPSSTPTTGSPTGTPVVATVNYPLAYFAERIGGDLVEVVFPAPGDGDPAFWTPDDAALATYQAADRILLNGATYAKWVPKVTLAPSKLVDTSAAAEDRLIAIEASTTHAHGPEGEHAHGGTAFTTWLDPDVAARQAEAVKDALIALLPEDKATLEANTKALLGDLESVAADIRRVVGSNTARPIVVSHPVYQYFARAYGLNTRAVHWEPDALPDADAWEALAAMRKDFPAAWMLWEGEPMTESVDRLKKAGMASAVFDPCGNRPDDGDFLSVMKQNVEQLKAVYAD